MPGRRAGERPADGVGGRPAYSVVVPEPADTEPAQGPQAPTLLRRVGALLVDWVIAQLVVVFLLRVDTTAGGAAALVPLGVFALYTAVLVAFTGGATLGHRLFGLQVWQVRPGPFPLQAVIRTLLLCLVLPAVLTSRDGRGFHDVWAGTRIVRP
jgi:uncharacterized RDD family membrane protein YckC